MPRYYFDTHDGVIIRDDIGVECGTFQEVLDEATSGLADFAQDAVPGAKLREMAVRVRDDQDRLVVQVTLRLEIKQRDDSGLVGSDAIQAAHHFAQYLSQKTG